jgi:hypothetical protein
VKLQITLQIFQVDVVWQLPDNILLLISADQR